jgi:hypothetical protein
MNHSDNVFADAVDPAQAATLASLIQVKVTRKDPVSEATINLRKEINHVTSKYYLRLRIRCRRHRLHGDGFI